MPTDTELFESLRLELRRGSLILAVLGRLRREHYGYTLRKALADAGVEIDEGALEHALAQMVQAEKRNKRFYRLSSQGLTVLGRLIDEWAALNVSITQILAGDS